MAFAVAVFGRALGCLMLPARKSAAYFVFIASLLGVIVVTGHTIGMAGSISAVPFEIRVGTLMSLVVAVFLLGYSKHAERKGWLR